MKDTGDIYIYGEGSPLSTGKISKIRRRRSITLVPYRTLSIRSFDYPFGSISAIREALRLQYSSVASGREVEIFPAVLRREDHRFSGAALVLPSEERAQVEEGLSGNGKTTLWPLPFALAAEIGGHGAAVCVVDGGISSALFVNGEPVVYRWQPLSRRTPEQEKDWLLSYGNTYDPKPADSIVVDVSENREMLCRGVGETLDAFPSFKNYSLSRKVLDSAIIAELLSRSISKLGIWMTVAGVLFSAAGMVKSETAKAELQEIKDRAVSVYREAFGAGNVRDPLSQARSLLAGATDRPDRPALDSCFRLLAKSWPSEDGGQGFISLDTLRYGSDGIDLIGTATEVSLVQTLQKTLRSESDGSIRLGDIQQVPGGGLRYSIEVRWITR